MDLKTEIRSSYKRAGFGACAVYGAFQTVGAIALGIGMMPLIATVMMNLSSVSLEELLRMYQSGELFQQVAADNTMWFTMIMYVLGSAGGMMTGYFLFRKILVSKYNQPIEKHRLSLKDYLLYLFMIFFVWGAGIFIGQFPALFFGLSYDSLSGIVEVIGVKALPIYIYAMIGAPVVEELVFRKALLDRLHPYGGVPAVILSGLLFGLIHGNSGQFFLAAFVGVIFAIVYLKTGNILYTVSFHMIINIIGSVGGIAGLFGTDLNTAMNVVILILALAGAAVFILTLVKKRDMLKVTLPGIDRANRIFFRNAGVIIAAAGGLVMLSFQDITAFVMLMDERHDPIVFTYLIPTLIAVIMTIVVINSALRGHYTDGNTDLRPEELENENAGAENTQE